MQFDEKFWLAISFIIFVGLSFKYIKQFLTSYIDQKITSLSEKIVEAENLRKEAEAFLVEINQKLTLQEDENKQLMDEAKINIASSIALKEELFAKELESKYAEAEKKLEQRKNSALLDLHKDFVEITHSLAERYIKEHQKELDSDIKIAKKYINF